MGKKGTPHRRYSKDEKMKYEADNLPDLLNKYVYFFNYLRPAAALGYISPVQYKTELGFL